MADGSVDVKGHESKPAPTVTLRGSGTATVGFTMGDGDEVEVLRLKLAGDADAKEVARLREQVQELSLYREALRVNLRDAHQEISELKAQARRRQCERTLMVRFIAAVDKAAQARHDDGNDLSGTTERLWRVLRPVRDYHAAIAKWIGEQEETDE